MICRACCLGGIVLRFFCLCVHVVGCSFLVSAQETNQRKRLLYAIFFGYFLVWLQESDTHRPWSRNDTTINPICRIPMAPHPENRPPPPVWRGLCTVIPDTWAWSDTARRSRGGEPQWSCPYFPLFWPVPEQHAMRSRRRCRRGCPPPGPAAVRRRRNLRW